MSALALIAQQEFLSGTCCSHPSFASDEEYVVQSGLELGDRLGYGGLGQMHLS